MDENSAYPRFQWSYMSGGAQYVVRSDDSVAYEADIAFVRATFLNKNSVVEKPVGKTCTTCGKPATEKKGTSKAGKDYHGIFCSSEDKAHTVWL